jgi:hypothetical protein
MSWVITGREAGPADPFIGSVSLLLHGNGTNGSTTITDSSLTPKTVTAFGNAQISTAQSKFGGASIAFDGTEDYALVPYSSAFNLESTDWTIELFAYPSSVSAGERGLVGITTLNATAGIVIRQVTNKFQAWVDGYQVGIITQSSTITALSWYHVALVRSGSTNTLYVNGSSVGSGSRTPITGSPTNIAIGRTYSNSNAEYFNGYIDDLRITKGVARYTANFTPPTAPFPDI